MLYELRHYDTTSDRGLARVIGRFADPALRLWEQSGIAPVGFWTVLIGPQSPRLTYLLSWEDLAQRQEKWDDFEANPEWRQALAETNARWGGSPIHTITNTILKPTLSSHLPTWDDQPPRLAGGVFELRTYRCGQSADLTRVAEWFGEDGVPVMERHGMFVMGLWTTYIGVSPRLTVMLVFENLAHRERAWAAFNTDPQWPAREDKLYPDGQPLVTGQESSVMRGTEFSGWR